MSIAAPIGPLAIHRCHWRCSRLRRQPRGWRRLHCCCLPFGLIGPLTAGLAERLALDPGTIAADRPWLCTVLPATEDGGPVYHGQISYVNTAVGLLVAVLALGERLPPASWAAVLLIVVGIGVVTVAAKNA